MEIFTEIKNWHIFEWVCVGAFGMVGITLQNIGKKLGDISNQISGENRHICQIREDRKDREDSSWDRYGADSAWLDD